MFASLELAGGRERLGVQGESVTVGAQRTGQRRRARRAALEVARDALGELLDQLGDVGIAERAGSCQRS
jgi:hypothetical protein